MEQIRTNQSDIYYRALRSRDRRFDGVFFTAVTSTGIYCRPICPAPTPLRTNVRFYPTSAAAEENGFRPCKRCRPDAAPGTPVWAGSSALVSQALRMIDSGFLDQHSVEELGARLGIGDRQLRRLFKTHLGAPPVAIALIRRLDFARKLIDETPLSMTEIAFSSGFESIRRFNDAVKKRFGQSPSHLRQTLNDSRNPLNPQTAHKKNPDAVKTNKSKTGKIGIKNSVRLEKGDNGVRLEKSQISKKPIRLHLPFRPPLEWESLLRYLRGRQISGVEHIDETGYSRCFRLGKSANGWLKVTLSDRPSSLALDIHMSRSSHLMTIVRRVRRIFDLDADPTFISQFFSRDPLLATSVERFPGLRVPGGWDNFEVAVRTIIGQQVSIPAANTIMSRLVQHCGEILDSPYSSDITHHFPSPHDLAGADLSGLGLPGKRIETIKTLASEVARGNIDLEAFGQVDEIKKQLLAIPGIGRWTVEYLGMRAFGEPDAFPGTDLALKRELNGAAPPESWRPWRSYAAVYLWKKYSLQEKDDEKCSE